MMKSFALAALINSAYALKSYPVTETGNSNTATRTTQDPAPTAGEETTIQATATATEPVVVETSVSTDNATAPIAEPVKERVRGLTEPDVYGPEGMNYRNDDANFDMSRIGIDITHHGEGAKCKQRDWTTIHWEGALKDGRIITSTKQEGGGFPRTFSLGAHEVFSCFDLAIPQLRQGDKAHISCPSHYVYGTAFIWAPVGGEPVPEGSDVDFDIEIVECNHVPENQKAHAQPKTTTMQPGRCMWFHSVASEDLSTPLVITCENEERINAPGFNYFPAVPCYLEEWVKDNEHQQFIFEESTGYVKDGKHSWELCSQVGMLALCDWANYNEHYAHGAYSSTHTDWTYDGVSQTIQHVTDWGAIFPYVQSTTKWAEVYLNSHTNQDLTALEDANAKFRIEYCWKNF